MPYRISSVLLALWLGATVLVLATAAIAGPTAPSSPCWLIRSYVTVWGEAAVEGWARSKGYTTDQIAATRRRCRV